MRAAVRTLVTAAAFLLTGCYTHNFPVHVAFAPELIRPPTIRVSVDADGTFYPDCWDSFVRPGNAWPGRSLLGTRTAPFAVGNDCTDVTTSLNDRLVKARTDQLDAIRGQLLSTSRVFIFVHGYNNSHDEADAGYDQLERAIKFLPGDLVIRFYWDGYVAKDGLSGTGSPAYFWFKAVKNSQLAGLYGLRPILALADHQQVVVISHSRGASVVLSALSNPPFDAAWQQRAAVRIGRLNKGLAPSSLPDRGGPIDAVMLAPAIGTLDFCLPATDIHHPCADARPFPARFRSLSYTHNPSDRILKKFVGLAHRFYPTSLGASTKLDVGPWVVRALAPRPVYRVEVNDQRAHAFGCYASHPALQTLLTNLPRVETRSGYKPPIAHHPECGWRAGRR